MSLVRLCWALLALLAAACSGGDGSRPPPIGGDGDADADSDADSDGDSDADADEDCIDYDGDGYGLRCDVGADCDDSDPGAWDDCTDCGPGSTRESCPCAGVEDPVDCHSDELFLDERTGRWRCRTGTRFCEDQEDETYAWGECIYDGGFL